MNNFGYSTFNPDDSINFKQYPNFIPTLNLNQQPNYETNSVAYPNLAYPNFAYPVPTYSNEKAVYPNFIPPFKYPVPTKNAVYPYNSLPTRIINLLQDVRDVYGDVNKIINAYVGVS